MSRCRAVAWTLTMGLAVTHCSAPAAPTPPAPGVPRSLAEMRTAVVRDLEYDLTVRVPEARDAPVTGEVTARFELTAPRSPLWFDFAGPAVDLLRVDGADAVAHTAPGHVAVEGLGAGRHEVVFAFTASDLPLNRNDEFLYSLFVPARAHEVFPVFDQPDLKARLTLTVEVPADWAVVANGRPAGLTREGDRETVRFAPTKPLPTYLMAFAAGRFTVEHGLAGDRSMRVFHRETDADRIARNRDAIFDLHAQALDWLEAYTGIPYPWDKLDIFLAPGFQFGGMEHAGAIFYRAPSLVLEAAATENQRLGRASLIAHETAHMWFGNLVTMRWFDDVWLKEVFANVMAAKIVRPAFPEVDHDLRFYLAHYRAAYDVDRTGGTHPIRRPLDNLADAGTMYGPIIYQKAPIVMRQLERLLGPDAFQAALRRYLDGHAYANATWPDLVAAFDAQSDRDVRAWSDVWVEQAGRPTLTVTPPTPADPTLGIRQEDPEAAGRLWPQALEIDVAREAGIDRLETTTWDAVTTVPAVAAPAPTYVLPTAGGLGYGAFELDEVTRAWLLESLPTIESALSRGAAWGTLWEELLDGRVAPGVLLDLALRWLPLERDGLNRQRLLSDVETLHWRWVGEAARAAVAPPLEATLRRGLDASADAATRMAWFRTLVAVATTDEALAWLSEVWRTEGDHARLALEEADLTSLAFALALREVPDWRPMLDVQEGRITNPDRQARFRFIRPAVDAEAATREAFFARLSDAGTRRREPWVLAAVGLLHHPLRATASVGMVGPALELVEEIQRTGDIFFPSRWLHATLGGHRSPDVAETVRTFLTARPDYPVPLRRLVLQAADDLFRVTEADLRPSSP